MKELIEAVKAEAQYFIEASLKDDEYHHNYLRESERKREVARERIKSCDDALDAIAGAARHLVGAK